MFQILRILRYTHGISTARRYSHSATLSKLKKIQADYQCEDGKPIWLKKGFTDRALYCTTCVLCGLGILMVLIFIYDNAKPNSWKSPTC